VLVTIPEKASILAIANILQQKGIITSKFSFVFHAFWSGSYTKLRAGQYAFNKGTNVRSVVHTLSNGLVTIHKVTIPEGMTVLGVKEILSANPCMSGQIEKLPPEGYVLPGTYYFSKGEPRQKVLNRVRELMESTLRNIRSEWLTPEELIIMASIVEKETRIPFEKQIIASIFLTRLKKRMRLQADPTIIYALSGTTGKIPRPLTRQDWLLKSPYNTYRNGGLPPTPICCPGKNTIIAVSKAAPGRFLYFVADGKGGHFFSEDLKRHNEALRLRNG
jgi:UPF0755 protein